MQRHLKFLKLAVLAFCWLSLSALSARANEPTVWLDVYNGVRVWHYDYPGIGIVSIGHEFGEGSCEVHVRLDSAGPSSAYYTHMKNRVVCRFRVRLVPHEPHGFSQHYFMQNLEAPKFSTKSLAYVPYNIVGPGNSIDVGTSVDVHFWPYDPFNGKTSSPEGPVMACQQRVENAGANRKKLLADGFTVPLRAKARLELRYVPADSKGDPAKSEDSIHADTDLDVVIRCLGNVAAANEAYPPPVRDHPFLVTAASLVLFHNGQPLTQKLEANCTVPIGHRPRFTTVGDLPGDVRYHFEWTSGQRSAPYVKTDKGDRNSPLYEVPEAYHEFPYPLAAGGGGGTPDPDGSFAAEGKGSGPKFAAPSGPQNEHKGSVRVVATNDSGATVASGWAPYHIICKQAAVAVSGTLDLRDSGGNSCPRRAEAAISIRTDVPGPVAYHVACDGGRTWSDTIAAQKTGPNTHIAVAVLPFQIERRESIACTLRTGKLDKVLARDSRTYGCTTGGGGGLVVVPPPPHPPPGEPPRVIVDPPKVACVGGRLAGAGKRQTCVCPGGHTLKRLGPTNFRCEGKATVGVTCIGGGVRNGQCVCAPSMRRVQAGLNAWRCVPRGGAPAGPFGIIAPGKGPGPTKPAPGIRKGSPKGAAGRVQ